MTITQRSVGAVTILDLPARFDVDHGVPEFRDTIRQLVEQGRVRILLDLARTEWMDDSATSAMVQAYTAALKHGGVIKLVHLKTGFRYSLKDLVRLCVFETYGSEPEALASFGGDKA